MSLNTSLLASSEPDPVPPDSKSCTTRSLSCRDRILWLISFVLALTGVVLAVVGVFTDVSTVYAYFSNGDMNWGIIAAVFTGLGWAFFLAVGVTMACKNESLADLSSGRAFGVLTALQLLPALLQLDAAASLWEHRHDKEKRDEAVGKSTARLNSYKMIESTFKTVPLLILHTYILLVNQLGSRYIGRRYTGLSRLSQLGSIASGVYFLAPCYLTAVFDSRTWIGGREALSRPQLLVFTLFLAVDSTVRVLRVAVLASSVHAWASLGVSCPILLLLTLATVRLGGAHEPSRWHRVFACSSPVSCIGVFSGYSPPSYLLPVFDGCMTAVMLAVPFALPARPFVHLHGVCSSLSDVNADSNCFPAPFVVAVAALVLLHWVLFAVVWRFPRK